MKRLLWFSVFILALRSSGCGDEPGYLCPDQSKPCYAVDAGIDADANIVE